MTRAGAIDATSIEHVVLLDDSGTAIGTADKRQVHHAATPLHLAFSCYVFDPHGEQLLLTRRAASKPTWPGAWTNTCCGHPSPGEDLAAAVRRRLEHELGLTCEDLMVILPDFRYRAEMPNGVRENEICPVLRAVTSDQPTLNTTEVDDHRWVPWRTFANDVLDGAASVSPWCIQQVRELASLGDHPLEWPSPPLDALPAAFASSDPPREPGSPRASRPR